MQNLRFWLGELLSHFTRTRVWSALSLALVAAILWVLGAGGLFLVDFGRALDEQTAQLELVVLLDKRISPARRRQIFEAARIEQVKKLELTLATAALKRYSAQLKLPSDDLRSANPLGDELRVELHDARDFWRVRDYLTSISGVIGARNSDQGASLPAQLRLRRSLRQAALLGGTVASAMLTFLIGNALRRSMRARAGELRLMRMVGATPAWMRAPFLAQGAGIGMVAALLALGILGAVSRAAIPTWFGLAMVAVGVLAGTLGAGGATRGVERDG